MTPSAAYRRVALAAGALGVVLCCTAASTRATPQRAAPCRSPAVYVDKSEGYVELRCAERAPQRFRATFGADPVGPKLQEGDERTPEGSYRVTSRVRDRRFHRFIGLSYPNPTDRARSRALGIRNPGRGIGIHGVRAELAALARAWLRVAPTGASWGPTDGCVAIANEDVEVDFDALRRGTLVSIVP